MIKDNGYSLPFVSFFLDYLSNDFSSPKNHLCVTLEPCNQSVSHVAQSSIASLQSNLSSSSSSAISSVSFFYQERSNDIDLTAKSSVFGQTFFDLLTNDEKWCQKIDTQISCRLLALQPQLPELKKRVLSAIQSILNELSTASEQEFHSIKIRTIIDKYSCQNIIQNFDIPEKRLLKKPNNPKKESKKNHTSERIKSIHSFFIATVFRHELIRQEANQYLSEKKIFDENIDKKFLFSKKSISLNDLDTSEKTNLFHFDRVLRLLTLYLPAHGNKSLFMQVAALLEDSDNDTIYITGGGSRDSTLRREILFELVLEMQNNLNINDPFSNQESLFLELMKNDEAWCSKIERHFFTDILSKNPNVEPLRQMTMLAIRTFAHNLPSATEELMILFEKELSNDSTIFDYSKYKSESEQQGTALRLDFETFKKIHVFFIATFIRYILGRGNKIFNQKEMVSFDERMQKEYLFFATKGEVLSLSEKTLLFYFEQAVLSLKRHFSAKHNKIFLLKVATLLEPSPYWTQYINGSGCTPQTDRRMKLLEYLCNLHPKKRIKHSNNTKQMQTGQAADHAIACEDIQAPLATQIKACPSLKCLPSFSSCSGLTIFDESVKREYFEEPFEMQENLNFPSPNLKKRKIDVFSPFFDVDLLEKENL